AGRLPSISAILGPRRQHVKSTLTQIIKESLKLFFFRRQPSSDLRHTHGVCGTTVLRESLRIARYRIGTGWAKSQGLPKSIVCFFGHALSDPFLFAVVSPPRVQPRDSATHSSE